MKKTHAAFGSDSISKDLKSPGEVETIVIDSHLLIASIKGQLVLVVVEGADKSYEKILNEFAVTGATAFIARADSWAHQHETLRRMHGLKVSKT